MDKKQIVEKFISHKFKDLDIDSVIGSEVCQKLQDYLLMEISHQDLFINRKYDFPSEAKYFGLINEESMKSHLQTILSLDEFDMTGPAGVGADQEVSLSGNSFGLNLIFWL